MLLPLMATMGDRSDLLPVSLEFFLLRDWVSVDDD